MINLQEDRSLASDMHEVFIYTCDQIATNRISSQRLGSFR